MGGLDATARGVEKWVSGKDNGFGGWWKWWEVVTVVAGCHGKER